MRGARLNKQRWINGERNRVNSCPGPNFLCESSLGQKKNLQSERNYRTDRFTEGWQKKPDCFFFFLLFSVLTCFVKSVCNIEVSIYTGAVDTEQQGQKKVERTKGGAKSRNVQKLATTLTPNSSCEKRCEDFFCCCVAAAAIIQYLQPSFPKTRNLTRTQ